MTGRPILFSGPMVRALLDGRKTQTRRVLKPQPNMLNGGKPLNDGRGRYSVEGGWKRYPISRGDHLWVRESLKRAPDLWTYSADGAEVGWPARQALAAKCLDYAPSIHMPKVASRLTLTVTDVRVQRLQDISEEDAEAEGALIEYGEGASISERRAFNLIWEHINGTGSWEQNPWVAAYTFTVEHRNINPGASS